MPWKVTNTVSERMNLIRRLEGGERMADVCRELEISCKTGYKFLERYKRMGPRGLFDESRAPIRQARKTSEASEGKILELKERHPTWGARKLREILLRPENGGQSATVNTIHRILARHGKVDCQKNRRTFPAFRSSKIASTTACNQIWPIDFKGQFRVQNGALCYPLTMTDHFSRVLLTCEGLEGTTSSPAQSALELAFREYGLPEAVLSDNGCPFGAPKGLFGLSRISLWLMRLNVGVLRIEPGHPEQNGRHERMHLTLKKATTRPAAKTMLQQQERFDRFRAEFNEARPHEALGMKTPASVWVPPTRQYPTTLPDPDYSACDKVSLVYEGGLASLAKNRKFALGQAFAGQTIGLTEVEDGLWRVTFMKYDLGMVDEQTRSFEAAEAFNLSPM